MLDKVLKMDTNLQIIKKQVENYKVLFAADSTIDAADQSMLSTMEKTVQAIEQRLATCSTKSKGRN